MSGYFEHVERELRAAVRARTHVPWYARRLSGLRLPPGAVAIAVSVLLALIIAAGGVILLGRGANRTGSASVPPGARALFAKLAVLRRPQTAADRAMPARLLAQLDRRTVPSLTRLVAAYPNGFKLFMTVGPLESRSSEYGVGLVHVGGGGGGETAAQLDRQLSPGFFGGGLVPGGELNNAIVPDGVAKVKWRFAGLELPRKHFPPVTIYPRVRNNVALAPVVKNQGLIQSVTEYSASGRVIAHEGPGG
ncbi:MAG: hypothetical protein M3065_16735 [Actinomycetota bacterium]|nr:hypothetical protein [Actinomycetota bacterium]